MPGDRLEEVTRLRGPEMDHRGNGARLLRVLDAHERTGPLPKGSEVLLGPRSTRRGLLEEVRQKLVQQRRIRLLTRWRQGRQDDTPREILRAPPKKEAPFEASRVPVRTPRALSSGGRGSLRKLRGLQQTQVRGILQGSPEVVPHGLRGRGRRLQTANPRIESERRLVGHGDPSLPLAKQRRKSRCPIALVLLDLSAGCGHINEVVASQGSGELGASAESTTRWTAQSRQSLLAHPQMKRGEQTRKTEGFTTDLADHFHKSTTAPGTAAATMAKPLRSRPPRHCDRTWPWGRASSTPAAPSRPWGCSRRPSWPPRPASCASVDAHTHGCPNTTQRSLPAGPRGPIGGLRRTAAQRRPSLRKKPNSPA